MKRSKLVYTGDTQSKESLVWLHTITSPTYQVRIGESKVKMHVSCSGAIDLDHKSRVLCKTQDRILQWYGALSSRTCSCRHIVSNQQPNPTVGWYQRKLVSLSNWRLGAQWCWYWASNNFSYICHWIGWASMSMTPHARRWGEGYINVVVCNC
jgi:hypothetical protein